MLFRSVPRGGAEDKLGQGGADGGHDDIDQLIGAGVSPYAFIKFPYNKKRQCHQDIGHHDILIALQKDRVYALKAEFIPDIQRSEGCHHDTHDVHQHQRDDSIQRNLRELPDLQ